MSKIINHIAGTKNELIDRFTVFIRSIGIRVDEGSTGTTTFFPGICIRDGSLVIDREQLQHPGDLLHEAGHIAVAPPDERTTLNDNVTQNRPGTEGEEMAVMLWTYAAALHLDIAPEIIFHPEGYRGDSGWIVEQYRKENFIGLPFLVWMGLASSPGEPFGFPVMKKWVRE